MIYTIQNRKNYLMNEFQILESIIHSDFKLSTSSGAYEFKESQAECKCVKIHNSGQSFALSLDNGKKVFSCFDPTVAGISKVNDGVIFFKKEDKFIVLLIELKSKNSGEYLKQLKSGRNFISYVINQINLNYPIDIQNIEYYGVLFDLGRQSASKNTTKRTALKFENRNGLLCFNEKCNSEYRLQQFKEAV